eukprot:7206300-Prymnesium_polylepis.1
MRARESRALKLGDPRRSERRCAIGPCFAAKKSFSDAICSKRRRGGVCPEMESSSRVRKQFIPPPVARRTRAAHPSSEWSGPDERLTLTLGLCP